MLLVVKRPDSGCNSLLWVANSHEPRMPVFFTCRNSPVTSLSAIAAQVAIRRRENGGGDLWTLNVVKARKILPAVRKEALGN